MESSTTSKLNTFYIMLRSIYKLIHDLFTSLFGKNTSHETKTVIEETEIELDQNIIQNLPKLFWAWLLL